ncbi:hypothetical protein Pmani_022243 [Petrolisthes manimaculis]|uniref:Uncharacterized protein n=1 Tax=Petrolisthes manimaculis TaxID=1843537 RepID=A0AAE1PE87_9EUCA|nr:hypothetical protein Pmani_022243 [Petrolisthes manimaculis]
MVFWTCNLTLVGPAFHPRLLLLILAHHHHHTFEIKSGIFANKKQKKLVWVEGTDVLRSTNPNTSDNTPQHIPQQPNPQRRKGGRNGVSWGLAWCKSFFDSGSLDKSEPAALPCLPHPNSLNPVRPITTWQPWSTIALVYRSVVVCSCGCGLASSCLHGFIFQSSDKGIAARRALTP